MEQLAGRNDRPGSGSVKRAFALLGAAAAGVALLVSAAPGRAASFTGTFAQDDSSQAFLLSLAAPADLTIRTWSYAGGTNAAGATIAAGGFDPIVSLFRLPSGTIAGLSDQGIGVAADPVTGSESDSLLQLNALAAGAYLAVLTQFDRFPNGDLADGFSSAEGSGNFTLAFGCSNGRFCDLDGNNRSASWALDVTGATTVSLVPEPAAGLLMACGLAALLLGRRHLRA